jgi:hypothetical protein
VLLLLLLMCVVLNMLSAFCQHVTVCLCVDVCGPSLAYVMANSSIMHHPSSIIHLTCPALHKQHAALGDHTLFVQLHSRLCVLLLLLLQLPCCAALSAVAVRVAHP